MSLKLIREATLVAKLSEAELIALSAMKVGSSVTEAEDEKMQLWTADSGNYDVHHPSRHKSIGHFKTKGEAQAALDKSQNKKMMGPIHQVAGYASWVGKNLTEAFAPSDDDFSAWLRVVVGEAQDRGISLNKKSQFVDLVMDVLENDPAAPPFDMQEMIAAKLWQDYNSAKNTVRINNVAKAKEEEESVEAIRKQILDRHAQGPTPAPIMPGASDEEEESEDTWGYSSNGIDVRLGDRVYAERHCREIGKKCVKLPALTKDQRDDRCRSDGQENRMMGNYEEEQMGMSDEQAANKIFNKIKGTPNLSIATVERFVTKYAPMVGKKASDVKYITALVYDSLQDIGMEDEESGFAQALKGSIGLEDEEEPSFIRDVLRDKSSAMKGSFSRHLRAQHGDDDFDDQDDKDLEDEDLDAVDGLSDDDVFTSDDELDDDELDDDELDDDELDDDEIRDDDDEIRDDDDDDEIRDDDDEIRDDDDDDEIRDDDDEIRHDDELENKDLDDDGKRGQKVYDEEEVVKSFFRQAVTSPRDMMNQAVKDIESEGKAAWKQANVPVNPHPQKSQAHRAWSKGMTSAAKEALGIVDKPAAPKAKPTRKK